MATGFARGAAKRGKKIAFGDGRKIQWGPYAAEIFSNNPNIARPGQEFAPGIEWIDHFKGHRRYNHADHANRRWIWNYDFKAMPGEFFFDDVEKKLAKSLNGKSIVIEPNVPWWKEAAPNKDWGEAKWKAIAKDLFDQGYDLVQFKHSYTRRVIENAKLIEPGQFRKAVAILSGARLYVGPEGGMHHAAAAVNIPAVILWGGFTPSETLGYDNQISLTGGAKACGSMFPCEHCKQAMASINVPMVLSSCMEILKS